MVIYVLVHASACLYMLCACMHVCMCTRAESGLDDLDDLGHLGQFLMGQAVSSTN